MSTGRKIFTHSVRVPYAHIDKMGFVYYAHYLVYFEMARSEMLRDAGLPYGELENRGIMLPVVEAHCQYKRSARYDDLLTITSQCTQNGIRLHVDYEMKRGEDVIVTGYTEHVCMSPEGKVLRPAPELKKLIE